MMANPIPLVPDLQKTIQEMEEIKIVHPKILAPVPIPTFEPVIKEIEKVPKEELQELKPVVEKPPLQVEVEPVSTRKMEPPEPLAALETLDHLEVTRRLQVRDVLSLRGKRNHFVVKTAQDDLVYTIEEQNRWWVGYCCYGLRPMQLRVLNRAGSEVLRIVRPYAFTTRLVPCQLQRMQVFSPPGHLIGYVIQQWTALRPLYFIKDAFGNVVFEVHGPRVTLSFYQNVKFHVRKPDGTLVAATNKPWEGLMHALLFAPVKEKFTISFFDKDMKREEKGLLLATALLFDYMYYDV